MELLLTFFTSTLFVAIPVGLGLLLLSSIRSHAGFAKDPYPPSYLALSFFLGAVLFASIHVTLEKLGWLQPSFRWLFFAILVASGAGFYRMRFALASFSYRQVLDDTSWAWGVFLFVYGFKFVYWSEHPHGDIFQSHHFYKAATEFARFGVLNQNTVDSYIHVIPSLLGSLVRLFHLKLIHFHWVAPFFSFALFSICTATLAAHFLPPGSKRKFAIAFIALANWASLSPLNGALQIFFFTLIFRFILTVSEQTKPSRLIALFSGYLLWFATLKLCVKLEFYWFLPFFTVGYLIFLGLSRRHLSASLLFLLITTAYPLHRSILMYLPIMLTLGGIRCLLKEPRFAKWSTLPRLRTSFVFVVLASFTACLLYGLNWFGYIHLPVNEIRHGFAKIGAFILQTPVDPAQNLATGGGFANAVVEWVRVISPTTHIWLFAVFLVGLFFSSQKHKSTSAYLLYGTFFCLALGFSKLPYAYRGLWISVLLISTSASLYWWDFSKKTQLKITGLTYLCFAGSAYFLYFRHQNGEHPYLVALAPFTLTGGLIAPFVLLYSYRKNAVSKNLFPAFILCIFALDQTSIATKFFTYSFGSRFPKSQIISHYNSKDLSFAESLENLPAGTVLMGDPPMLGLVRMFSGANAIFPYQNLLDLGLGQHGNIYAFFNEFKKKETQSQIFMNRLETMGKRYPETEASYFWKSYFAEELTLKKIKKNLVILLTHRTLNWTECFDSQDLGCSYFPEPRDLPIETVRYIEKNFKIIKRSGNYAFAIQLR